MVRENKIDDKQLVVIYQEKWCVYHKCNDRFDLSALTPDGMCPKAFYTGYPYFLGLFYDAWKGRRCRCGLTFICSGKECQAVWLVRGVTKWYSLLLRLAEALLAKIGRHPDFPTKVIEMKVLSASNNCQMKCRIGDLFISDLIKVFFGKKIFCPQSFYTIYPYLSGIDNGFCTPWSSYGEQWVVNCPAFEQKATYAIRKK